MIHSIYPTIDTTLYEYYPAVNTGLDAVLDLSKHILSESIYNNRALLKFDLSSISRSIVLGEITTPKYYLNLYTVDVQEIPVNYTVTVHPVSQSWDSGTGRYINNPQTLYGASWTNRFNTAASTVAWTTSSFAANTTGSTTLVSGGGTWYTNYEQTQSYNNSNTDIRIDVTTIVNAWLNGTIQNDGFIIKKSHTDELSRDNFQTLKYFSVDSQTVYTPKLEIAWDNSVYTTGSLTQPANNKDITLYLPNLKKSYNEASRVKLDVKIREKYPTITFATQSNYLTVNYLPTSSLHYSVRYADTDEVVIPFDDTYTKVSCTSSGNFVNMWLDGLYAEKYYKFVFKVERDSSVEYFDNNYIFKVTK